MITKKLIEEFLRQAEKAHAQFERELGHKDANWAEWYAEYIYTQLKNMGEI